MIKERLLSLREEAFADFQRKLMPTVAPEKVLGVRTPCLRALAKELRGTEAAEKFMKSLPHETFEENNLHAFLLEQEADFDVALMQTRAFLPYVDNWATCDQLSPKAFAGAPNRLLPDIEQWLKSDHTYTVRFGIGMLMRYFLDARFDNTYPLRVAKISSKAYYVNMMIAWYFATALAKQYEAVLPYFETQTLDRWTHNKALQKAMESNRIPVEHKQYLKTLRI